MEQAALYFATMLTLAGIYAALSLGLNLQWGLTGLMNFGGLGFVAVGAYTAALLTAPASASHLGGFGWPWWLAWPLAAVAGAVLALPIGAIALRLRADYLAVATIGIAEIVRLAVRNEDWLTGGPLGVPGIPRPFETLGLPWGQFAYLALVAAIVAGLFALAEATARSPFGRALRAVRDSGGAFVAVPDDAILAAIPQFARLTGVFAEPASAASWVGAQYAREQGFIHPDDRVLILSTGSGLKDVARARQSVNETGIRVQPTIESVRAVLRLDNK